MSDWTVRGPNQTGPWKGGYYISRPEAASACAFAQNKKDADRIVRSINAVPALIKVLEELCDQVEADEEHGADHAEDDCPICIALSSARAALAIYQKDS